MLKESPTLSEKLQTNLTGDKIGRPGWYTHFGATTFAESAIPTFVDAVAAIYPQDKPLTVVGLGSGNGTYELTVSKYLRDKEGYDTKLLITDLQQGSLDETKHSDIPLVKLRANITQLPLQDSIGGALVLSRAVEHYLAEGELEKLIGEAGRILSPGELYVAQISSGDPLALGALSKGIKAIGDKDETFLSLDEYRNKVGKVKQKDGITPVFDELTVGYAETQTNRGVFAQARRYLNKHFLNLKKSEAGNNFEAYKEELNQLSMTRDNLGGNVHDDKSRQLAITKLDKAIQSTDAFDFFRGVYIESVTSYLKDQGIQPMPGFDQSGIRIVGEGATITDIVLDVEYPIIVLQKREANRATRYGQLFPSAH